jgi:hypothetical protein
MIRPAYPKGAKTTKVYGTVMQEDFELLFREVLPAWGAARRIVAHLIHILAHHVRHNNIHKLPTNAERTRAVERILADMSVADFSTGGAVGERRDANGQRFAP